MFLLFDEVESIDQVEGGALFVATQVEPDTTDLERTFELIATGVRATGERLIEEARAPGDGPGGKP